MMLICKQYKLVSEVLNCYQYDTSFEDITVLLKENNKFKLYLKESPSDKMGKLELNRNIYSSFLELFDDLFSQFAFHYLHIYLHELIIHVIFMTFCQFLIAVLCYLKMLPMKKRS